MKYLLTIGLTLILVACGQKSNTEKYVEKKNSVTQTTQNQDTVMTQKVDIKTIHKSDFEKFLNDPKTPKMAIELYHNTYKLKDDEPLELLENLYCKDVLKRWFYFRVITNSYKISDSSYSEGLGSAGKDYIENKTCEFASYFDNKECFTNRDLEIWAEIAVLEFQIDTDLQYNENDKVVIDNFNKKLMKNCQNCTQQQKETIKLFGKILNEKWFDYLDSTN